MIRCETPHRELTKQAGRAPSAVSEGGGDAPLEVTLVPPQGSCLYKKPQD